MDSLREVVCDNVTRTERRKQEVREKILGAAFDLFLAQGVNATKIEEIASAPTWPTGPSSTTSPLVKT